MSVGVMEDYKLRDLLDFHTLGYCGFYYESRIDEAKAKDKNYY